jgi:hypothetical protein
VYGFYIERRESICINTPTTMPRNWTASTTHVVADDPLVLKFSWFHGSLLLKITLL